MQYITYNISYFICNIYMRIYNYKYRFKLNNLLRELNDMDIYNEIYVVIKNNDITFTKNSNGIFFDLNKIDDSVIELIITLIKNYDSNSDSEIY